MKLSQPLILVVDDDLSIVRLLWLTLTESGYEVVTASNGVEALARLQDRTPEVIVLDLEIPAMDGRTFYLEIRANACLQSCEVPVLILSAYSARQARTELAAEAALEKPFIADRLDIPTRHELSPGLVGKRRM